MRKTIVLITMITGLLASHVTPAAAQVRACCSAPGTFASLASDEAFVDAHAEPLRMQYPTDGDMRSIEVPGDKPTVVYSVQPKTPTTKVLLVFHEWWGLNEHIKREADALYKALDGEVHVIAVDLYDGYVAHTRDEAASAMKNLRPERAEVIVNAVLASLHPDARVATIGWCMGGSYAMQAGIQAGAKAAAVVMYYGMPEKDVERMKTLRAPVLAHFASKDDWVSPEVGKQFERDMKQAGKQLTLKTYEAKHAFANPSNPDHDHAATQTAMAESVAFLRTHLLK